MVDNVGIGSFDLGKQYVNERRSKTLRSKPQNPTRLNLKL